MATFFAMLSDVGILVGLFLISQGLWGDGVGAFLALTIGVFVTFKEIMDMFFAGGP